MYNIILLSSIHTELGKCNSNELYGIIEKIRPVVIFEELPKDMFDEIYIKGYKSMSLETITIKKYLEKYSIKHIPVDTHEIKDSDIFDEFNIISDKSIEYVELLKQQISMVSQYGYSFLSSNQSIELIDNLHIIEKNILSQINNIKLSKRYNTYCELNNKRENEMLENIYNYSKQFQYHNAMFICGAEHRKSIIQKISEYEKMSKIKLNWNFNIP